MTENKRKENADIPEKEGRFTKHVLKTLFTLNIKSHNAHSDEARKKFRRG